MKLKRAIMFGWGNLYRVLGSARNAITLTPMIVFESFFKNRAGRHWFLPVAKFTKVSTKTISAKTGRVRSN